MQFDKENAVIQLCARGIETEGKGDIELAKQLYKEAWELATNDFEQFTAAHYMARNQEDPYEELKWNELSLAYALKIDDPGMKGTFPSLYLNIGKSYEQVNDIAAAKVNYQRAQEYIPYLGEDGYGRMIAGGIREALKRVSLYNAENR